MNIMFTEKEKNFWQKLPKPFFVLAPMYDVTDAAFRKIIAKYSSPDVIFTEFVNVDGLCHEIGREKLLPHLWKDASEGHVVAQIWGKDLKNYEEIARQCVEMGFSGVDINMGCPEKSAEKQDACAKLMIMPEKAVDVIEAVKSGVGGKIPVSVKTRIGYSSENINNWIGLLLEQNIDALTVHLRTRAQMSKVPANWDYMKKIVFMAKNLDTKIIGNGDVKDVNDAREKVKQTGVDGIMFGRAVFGNPWLFRHDNYAPSVKEKLEVMIEHTQVFEEMFKGVKNFAIMKKHYKAYANGFPNATSLREKLMSCNNYEEVKKVTYDFLNKNYKTKI